MKFTKMHGIGNDYVYVNCFKETVKHLHRSLEQEKIQKSLDLKIYYQKKKSKQRSEKH